MFDLRVAKRAFFDRAKVRGAVDAGTRRALSKFGAFVRQRAKTSIRKREGTSAPGHPPYSHTGLLRKWILFGYDAANKSVVIGPVLAGSQSGAPARLEYGGTATVGRKKPRTAKYQPRPYMRPAYLAELPTAPQLFKDCIR